MSTVGQERMGSRRFVVSDSGSERDANGVPQDAAAGGKLPREAEDPPVLEDLLVEDVSIDGMCGVY